MNARNPSEPQTLRFDGDRKELILLDQTRLPGEVVHLRLRTPEQVYEAIRTLRVRGAPAIGIAAAFGALLGILEDRFTDAASIRAHLEEVCDYLARSRPTAVNLFWALDRMKSCARDFPGNSGSGLKAQLQQEAESILREDEDICRRIGEHGLALLTPGMGILTHCNAGALATSRYGTALAPVHLGQQKGYGFRLYADETRPLLQGARLTAYELMAAGVDTTLLCDSMVASLMQAGSIQAVLVGSDRIAANGDIANKIGTCGVAILARHFHIPFYVCAPISTFDRACPNGRSIRIEHRGSEEVTEMWYRVRMAPEGVKVYNPAFDVTDAGLVDAIVTERGVLRPPYPQAIARLFDEKENVR